MPALIAADAKRVEWIGLPSAFGDPEVQRRLAYRLISEEGRAALWALERKRQAEGFARFQGRTQRCLGTADGLSRDYVWGPHDFVQLMDPDDIRILMDLHPAHRRAFRVLDDLVVVRR